MTQSDPKEPPQPKPITAKRRARIEKEFEAMGRGYWTYAEIAEYVGVSEPTVKRDMKHPYAHEYVEKLQERRGSLADQLIKRQIDQIEAGIVKPHLQLLYRGRMIDGLLPKKVIQKVSGELQQKIEVEGIELKGLDEDAVGAIVQNFMDDEARKLRQSESTPIPGSEEQPEDGLDTPG